MHRKFKKLLVFIKKKKFKKLLVLFFYDISKSTDNGLLRIIGSGYVKRFPIDFLINGQSKKWTPLING